MIYESDIISRFDIPESVTCCESCHEDADRGYDLLHVVVDGEDVMICCKLYNWLDANIKNHPDGPLAEVKLMTL